MAEPVALVALACDAAFGWPAPLYARVGHPVGAFAYIIERCEQGWNTPKRSEISRRLLGTATLLLLIGVVVIVCWLIQMLARQMPAPWGWLTVAVLAFPALAQRSLYDHVRPVALLDDDLDAARAAVGRIVGRDTAALDRAGVARAAIESLAESFCDGIVAPLFWLLLLGLPGIWAFKAINTADSLIGHRELRWRAFGWAAARTDDLANIVPARLAGALICLVGGGWRTMWRDAGKHASPNAGWPEAAMAGALGVRLGGSIAYDGAVLDKPWIGTGRAQATAGDLRRALALYIRACLLLAVAAGIVAWAR